MIDSGCVQLASKIFILVPLLIQVSGMPVLKQQDIPKQKQKHEQVKSSQSSQVKSNPMQALSFVGLHATYARHFGGNMTI